MERRDRKNNVFEWKILGLAGFCTHQVVVVPFLFNVVASHISDSIFCFLLVLYNLWSFGHASIFMKDALPDWDYTCRSSHTTFVCLISRSCMFLCFYRRNFLECCLGCCRSIWDILRLTDSICPSFVFCLLVFGHDRPFYSLCLVFIARGILSKKVVRVRSEGSKVEI